jgi:hypothetical protein
MRTLVIICTLNSPLERGIAARISYTICYLCDSVFY